MSAIMDLWLNHIFSVRAPLWLELLFVASFGLGFIFLRVELFRGRSKASAARRVAAQQTQLRKAVAGEVAAGHMTAAVKAWEAVKARAPTQLETLKLVVQAILEIDPKRVVKEIEEHIADNNEVLCNTQTAVAILDAVSRTGNVNVMEELHTLFSDRFLLKSVQIYEVLLSGYASAGDKQRVAKIMAECRAAPVKASARGYSLTIRGFLKHGLLDAALEQMLDMHRADFDVPWIAITQLVRAACEVGRGIEMFDSIEEELPLPPEAVVLLLEDCLKRGDLVRARHVEQVAREHKGSPPLLIGAYDALLKTCVLHSDLYALELFEEMQKANMRISEGLCVGLLARCADTKFLRFAEEIAKVVRGRDGMTIAVYSALMKVYAYAGMHSKACDLYDQIVAEGMEPDAMMYGCLMKFAVECGRTDLSRELFSKAPNLDIQNYMSLIKAAGRDRDIGQAFGVLQKLKESGVTPDVAAYSSVLDVCVSARDLSRARELMDEMRSIGKLDIISYNTFLKGLCSMGNIRGAKELLTEMENIGMRPNDVSFNCLINAAVSRGMWQEAWNTVNMMERSGVQVDNYTVSIMLKSLKKEKDSSRDVGRALALLDRSGLDVCSDEVLLNTVLETCIKHREYRRLENIINAFSKSSIQPSVHIYGGLIKACSTLKRLDKCWEFWYIMVNDRAMDPNDVVLGCMLDALVCNKRTEEAVILFREWQPKVPANTIIYSTLIKGFANSRQASRAMDMWREMLDQKMPMNNMVYNAVIDAQARVGAMDEVGLLVKSMAPHGCTPDSITYSTIVKGYCFRGDLDKAFEVLRDMQQNQMATDSVIYNTLLDGCVRNNRMDLADTLLEDMERFRITPSNVTLGILVKMYGRRKQLNKAFQMIDELPAKHGFKANAQVKTCLMSACFYNHDVNSALKVFEELRDSEQGADWKIYSSMISGFLRHGFLERAVAVVEDAYGLRPGSKTAALSPGQGLETESLEQLLRAIEEGGQMESVGVPLMQRLRAAKIPICGKFLSKFTSA